MRIRRFFKGRKGQKGFTLIELLVVIAILGVLAAVIIPNVASFIGEGTVEAANTESAETQLAVVAYMAANNLTDCDGTLGSLDGGTTPGDLNLTAGVYILNIGKMQALYTVTDGVLTDATPDPDGKWKSLAWANGSWAAS